MVPLQHAATLIFSVDWGLVDHLALPSEYQFHVTAIWRTSVCIKTVTPRSCQCRARLYIIGAVAIDNSTKCQ